MISIKELIEKKENKPKYYLDVILNSGEIVNVTYVGNSYEWFVFFDVVFKLVMSLVNKGFNYNDEVYYS